MSNQLQKLKDYNIYQFLTSLLISMSVLVGVSLLAGQSVDAAPFTCSAAFYQVINGTLVRLDTDTGDYTTIGGTGDLQTNAIGYNLEDNYIYGIGNGIGNVLLRIEHDATTTNLGLPTNLPLGGTYVAGDFDASGNLYVLNSGTALLYRVDVSTNIATLITLNNSVNVNDLVYVDGLLYGLTSGTTLYEINPNSATATAKTIAISPASGSVYGAGWATSSDELYFSRNTDGVIYQLTSYSGASPVATPVFTGDTASGNDGAACVAADSPLPVIIAVDDSGSTRQDTVLEVSANSGLLVNDSGQAITVTSFTQPDHGSVVVNSDGSYVYTPAAGFSGVDSFTYTITDTAGQTRIATVTITVTGDVAEASSTLAETGSNITNVAFVGLVLIASSGTFLIRFRRKQHIV